MRISSPSTSMKSTTRLATAQIYRNNRLALRAFIAGYFGFLLTFDIHIIKHYTSGSQMQRKQPVKSIKMGIDLIIPNAGTYEH